MSYFFSSSLSFLFGAFLFFPVSRFHLLYSSTISFLPFSGNDTKWPTRVDRSLNHNTINKRQTLREGKNVNRTARKQMSCNVLISENKLVQIGHLLQKELNRTMYSKGLLSVDEALIEWPEDSEWEFSVSEDRSEHEYYRLFVRKWNVNNPAKYRSLCDVERISVSRWW